MQKMPPMTVDAGEEMYSQKTPLSEDCATPLTQLYCRIFMEIRVKSAIEVIKLDFIILCSTTCQSEDKQRQRPRRDQFESIISANLRFQRFSELY